MGSEIREVHFCDGCGAEPDDDSHYLMYPALHGMCHTHALCQTCIKEMQRKNTNCPACSKIIEGNGEEFKRLLRIIAPVLQQYQGMTIGIWDKQIAEKACKDFLAFCKEKGWLDGQ